MIRSNYRSRPLGNKSYRPMFIIVTEGTDTEKEYFNILKRMTDKAIINILPNKCVTPPEKALQKIKKYLKENKLNKNDKAWIVIDRDSWPEEHLDDLSIWAKTNEKYGVALSNPNFEYWLLLHYEDGSSIKNKNNFSQRFSKYFPNYEKHIESRKITKDRIQQAIKWAKNRDTPACQDWPHNTWCTTVYRLVEMILPLDNS